MWSLFWRCIFINYINGDFLKIFIYFILRDLTRKQLKIGYALFFYAPYELLYYSSDIISLLSNHPVHVYIAFILLISEILDELNKHEKYFTKEKWLTIIVNSAYYLADN